MHTLMPKRLVYQEVEELIELDVSNWSQDFFISLSVSLFKVLLKQVQILNKGHFVPLMYIGFARK